MEPSTTSPIIEEAIALAGVLEDENMPPIPQELMEIGWTLVSSFASGGLNEDMDNLQAEL